MFKGNAATPNEFYEKKEQLAREYKISLESMDLLRKELQECVRTESINHFTRCKDLREKYFSLCTDKFRGMNFPEGEEPLSRKVPGLIAPKSP